MLLVVLLTVQSLLTSRGRGCSSVKPVGIGNPKHQDKVSVALSGCFVGSWLARKKMRMRSDLQLLLGNFSVIMVPGFEVVLSERSRRHS